MTLRKALNAELQLAQQKALASGAPKSVTAQKIEQCLNSVADFLGGPDRDVPLLNVMARDWLPRFSRFLTLSPINRYDGKPLSTATAAARTERIKSAARAAIKAGSLPNIPIVAADPTARREIGNLPHRRRRDDLLTLLSLFHYKKERLQAAILPAKERRLLRRQTIGLGYAILATLLCGIGYDGLALLPRTALRDDTLLLPHLRTAIPLSRELREIIEYLAPQKAEVPETSETSQASEHPLLLFDRPIGGAEVEHIALQALEPLALSFAAGFRHPFTQWLEIALAAGAQPLSIEDARTLITRLFPTADSSSSAADSDLAEQATVSDTYQRVLNSLRYLGYEWYCIRCLDKTKGESMLTLLRERLKMNPVDSFAPRLARYKYRGSKKVVLTDRFLDSLLFLKVNYPQLESVNRLLLSQRCGFIYSHRDTETGVRFAPISDREIELLRAVFRERAGRRLDTTGLTPRQLKGMQVRIREGYYDGFQGTISRVVLDTESHVRHLEISFHVGTMHITHTVDPDFLDLPL